MAPRYAPLAHEDSDDECSPEGNILSVSTTSLGLSENPTAWSTTLEPAILLRLASLVMATVTLVLFILDGGVPFIAAIVFLPFIMLLDFSMIVHHVVSNMFTITIELRNGSWRRNVHSSDKPSVAMYFDIGFTACFTICNVVGNGLRRDGFGAWIGGAVLGYLVILLHIALAVPAIHKNALTLTFTAKVQYSQGNTAPDIKTSIPPMSKNAGSDIESDPKPARVRPADDEPRQLVEDLV